MPRILAGSVEAVRIDAALRQWRQGDTALEERWFVHAGDPRSPLTDAAAEADGDLQALTTEVVGLVVATQTCDVVRSCVDRPFVDVSPLVQITDDQLFQVRGGNFPGFAFLPGVADHRLVAHLDRTMTVEKSIVAGWIRTPGLSSDEEVRAFSDALARKRRRFAFPDDFTDLVRKLRNRILDKHDRTTDEGRGLRSLREIRVQASPAWDGQPVTLTFWFIRKDRDVDFEGKNWADLLDAWLNLVPENGRFTKIHGQVASLKELTAADYVNSDQLDLDHVSQSSSWEAPPPHAVTRNSTS